MVAWQKTIAFVSVWQISLGYKVSRPDDTESTVRGAAVLAGLGSGKFSGLESATRNWTLDTLFEPSLAMEKRDDIVSGYQKALQQSSS